MRVRFSTIIGMPVTDDGAEEVVGVISGVLVNPDLGKIEGFFVHARGFSGFRKLFLSSYDIAHFGSRVRIRSIDVLSQPEDIVRLKPLLEDSRPVLGQRILTESETYVGMCRDIQFESKTFLLEWIFPRNWLRWKEAIPRTAILQVRPDAIIIRDPAEPVTLTPAEAVLKTLDPLATGQASSRVVQRSSR